MTLPYPDLKEHLALASECGHPVSRYGVKRCWQCEVERRASAKAIRVDELRAIWAERKKEQRKNPTASRLSRDKSISATAASELSSRESNIALSEAIDEYWLAHPKLTRLQASLIVKKRRGR